MKNPSTVSLNLLGVRTKQFQQKITNEYKYKYGYGVFFILFSISSPSLNRTDTDLASLQFDKHMQLQGNKFYLGKYMSARK